MVAVEVFLYGARATDILQHDALFMSFTKEIVAQEGDNEVGGDEVALFVDKGDAVGIAVEQQADVTMLFLYQSLDLLLASGFQRIGLVVGEVAVQGVVDIMGLIS